MRRGERAGLLYVKEQHRKEEKSISGKKNKLDAPFPPRGVHRLQVYDTRTAFFCF